MNSRNRLIFHLVGVGLLIAPFVIFFFMEGISTNRLWGTSVIPGWPTDLTIFLGLRFKTLLFVSVTLGAIAISWSLVMASSKAKTRNALLAAYAVLTIASAFLFGVFTGYAHTEIILILTSGIPLAIYHLFRLFNYKLNFQKWKTWQYFAASIGFTLLNVSVLAYIVDELYELNSGLSNLFSYNLCAIISPSIAALIAYITYARDAWLQFHNPDTPLQNLINEMGK
ncbi:MAG: hypothetical protein AB8F95_18985 [Bacteroidia bacterium]